MLAAQNEVYQVTNICWYRNCVQVSHKKVATTLPECFGARLRSFDQRARSTVQHIAALVRGER
jgi:hypothetical protein